LFAWHLGKSKRGTLEFSVHLGRPTCLPGIDRITEVQTLSLEVFGRRVTVVQCTDAADESARKSSPRIAAVKDIMYSPVRSGDRVTPKMQTDLADDAVSIRGWQAVSNLDTTPNELETTHGSKQGCH
jgi:hypothetical protein